MTRSEIPSPDEFLARRGVAEIIPPRPNGRDIIRVASAGAWPAPDMSVLGGGLRSAPPLPIDVLGDHLAREITILAEAKGAPVDYVFAAALAGMASLIGNARWVEAWPGYCEPTALWIAAVGGPSSGKSPAFDPILTLLREIETERAKDFETRLRRWAADAEGAKLRAADWLRDVEAAHSANVPPPAMPESAIEPPEPGRPRAIYMDSTTEQMAVNCQANDKGALLYRDELSGLLSALGRYGNDADRPFLIEAYGGRPFVIDRRKEKRPIIIKRLLLSVAGGIQPDRLKSLLIDSDDDGLCARFLMVWPQNVPPRRPSRGFDLAPLRRAFQRLDALAAVEGENGPEPEILSLNPAAADAFQAARERLYAGHSGASGVFGSFIGKLPGVILRLASVLTLSDFVFSDHLDPPSSVEVAEIKRAAHLAEAYYIPMAARTLGDAAVPQADRDAASIAREILRRRDESVNAREIRHRWAIPGLRSADRVDAALRALEEASWLRPAPTRRGSSAGRQSKTYDVNPRVFERAPAVPASVCSDSSGSGS